MMRYDVIATREGREQLCGSYGNFDNAVKAASTLRAEGHEVRIVLHPEDLETLRSENARLREALEQMTTGACLQQVTGHTCHCYPCTARRALAGKGGE